MSLQEEQPPPISLYLELSIITVWRPPSVAPSLSYIRLCFLLSCQVQLQTPGGHSELQIFLQNSFIRGL